MPVVFRDFGTTNPWTADFSLDVGPNTTGFGADHTATVRRDFGEIAEFRTGQLRDFVVPKEQTGGIAASGNYSPAIEWLRALNGASVVDATELRSAVFRDGPGQVIESRSTGTYDVTFSLNAGETRRRDIIAPQEAIGGAGIALNSSANIDWSNTLSSAFIAEPTEWQSVFVRDVPGFAEWSTKLAVVYPMAAETNRVFAVAIGAIPADFSTTAASSVLPGIEWRSPVTADVIMPAERVGNMSVDFQVQMSRTSLVLRDDYSPLQFLPTISRDDIATFETGFTPVPVIGDSSAGIEWRGGFTTDRSFLIEYRAALIRDMVVVSEWTGGAASFADALIQIEFGAGVLRALPVSTDMGSSVLLDPEIVAMAEAATVSELAPVSEYTLTVIGENFLFPDADSDLATVDSGISAEWSSLFVTGNATLFFEWVRDVQTEYTGPTDWTSNISADVLALIESQHTFIDLSVDAEIPIEWSVPVLVDVVVSGEGSLGREAIGASLEPDDWEEDHG